jgi:hypothetical protein
VRTIESVAFRGCAVLTRRQLRRLGVTGEFRLRGHEWDFTGTPAEISAGLTWRFASF